MTDAVADRMPPSSLDLCNTLWVPAGGWDEIASLWRNGLELENRLKKESHQTGVCFAGVLADLTKPFCLS